MTIFDRYMMAMILLKVIGVDPEINQWWVYGLLAMGCIAHGFDSKSDAEKQRDEIVNLLMKRLAAQKAEDEAKHTRSHG